VTQIEGVPEGWELVAIRVPRNEWVIDCKGNPFRWESETNNDYTVFPIIRKLETWRPAAFVDIGCERARFRESESDGWVYGRLMGAAYNLDGIRSWKMLLLDRVGWVDICEVCEDAK